MDIERYEVIADFPASMLEVGQVFEVYKSSGMMYVVEIDDVSEKYDVRDYPHLFKKLED